MSSQTSKTWFITGAASGFGRAFAEHALSRGYNVVATARNLSKLRDILDRSPDRVLLAKLDVNRPDEAKAAIAAAVARFGQIDVLINNAGYALVGALEETSEAELRAIMETNFFGAMAVTQAALPVLRSQCSGAIVNISSLGGQLSFAGFSAYCASKFALEGASEALAQEMAPFGVKVLIVEPGAFRTGLAGGAMRDMPIMDAYRSSVGSTRSFAHGMHQSQDGDPGKAAVAIERALCADKTPLRLQLGKDAIGSVRAHAQSMLNEMAQWEPISIATSFEAAEQSSVPGDQELTAPGALTAKAKNAAAPRKPNATR
jgi:NAD(P)-dependent dehydrogenase (short-subunit alcohol dehydrogenase family)